MVFFEILSVVLKYCRAARPGNQGCWLAVVLEVDRSYLAIARFSLPGPLDHEHWIANTGPLILSFLSLAI